MPTFKPQTPTIVDPTGVPPGNEPRPMGTSAAMSRGEVAAEGAGIAELRGADGSGGLGECGQ